MDALDALKLSRQSAISLSTKLGRTCLLHLLSKADRELSQRLKHSYHLSGPGKDPFTPTQMQATLAQIRAITASVTHGLQGILKSQFSEATDKAVGHFVEYVNKAEKQFKGMASQPLPIREVELLDKAAAGVNASILRRIASDEVPRAPNGFGDPRAKYGILQRYGLSTIDSFEDRLQQGLVQRKNWLDVRNDLVSESPFLKGVPGHWAERIVRTETMGAYNRAGWETVRTANNVLGDMCKILSATFDNRTSWDSYQVHGQIRRPEEAFQTSEGFVQNPPARPNDREIVVPHRISWPIPNTLRWRSDAEVLARYRMQRKTGSPGPRPQMTTIPIERFGKG